MYVGVGVKPLYLPQPLACVASGLSLIRYGSRGVYTYGNVHLMRNCLNSLMWLSAASDIMAYCAVASGGAGLAGGRARKTMELATAINAPYRAKMEK
jgi:hypothetical protein